MKHSAKAVAARQPAREVPQTVQKLIDKKLLLESVAVACQERAGREVVAKLVEDLECMAFEILPANFDDAEREEICTDLTAKAFETLGPCPVRDPIVEAVTPANDPSAADQTEPPVVEDVVTPPSPPSGAPDPVATGAAPPAPPEPATEQGSSEAAMVPAMQAAPVTTNDVEAQFEAECEELSRKITAHEVAYALGWYPLADAIKALRDRYQGRVQNIALKIANLLDRSRRWVFILLEIAEHPPELRERLREAGLADDQGRVLQFNRLSAEDGERALGALATGGPKAFDAVVRGVAGIHERAERDPVFAATIADFTNPTHPLGVIATTSPDTPLPADLTSRYPELGCMTFGAVLAEAKLPKPMAGENAEAPSKTKATRAKRFSEGFDLRATEERDVRLRAARIALVVTKVVDGEGKLVENAVVTVMVCDRTK